MAHKDSPFVTQSISILSESDFNHDLPSKLQERSTHASVSSAKEACICITGNKRSPANEDTLVFSNLTALSVVQSPNIEGSGPTFAHSTQIEWAKITSRALDC